MSLDNTNLKKNCYRQKVSKIKKGPKQGLLNGQKKEIKLIARTKDKKLKNKKKVKSCFVIHNWSIRKKKCLMAHKY